MIATLASRLTGLFDASVRARGDRYYRRGAVRILHGSEEAVSARVRGSRSYDASMELKDGVLTLSCSCPHFGSAGACKHLWATVLAAEAQGHLSGLRAGVQIELGGDAEDWDFDEDEIDLPAAPSITNPTRAGPVLP